jgi:hypothetical protein
MANRRIAALALLLSVAHNIHAPLSAATPARSRVVQHTGTGGEDAGTPARLAAIEKAVEERRRAAREFPARADLRAEGVGREL